MGRTTLPPPPPPAPTTSLRTLADLLRELGDIPAERVLLKPSPGTATEQDVVRLVDGDQKALVELVHGTLVEKPVGLAESLLAGAILAALRAFVIPRNLGIVAGADDMLRMQSGNIRLPDVSFIAWNDIPGGKVPREPVPKIPPTLAVEVLSATNTRAEMRQKRQEYFESGTKLVWEVDPETRTVAVYTGAHSPPRVLSEAESLDGQDVLPGFVLPLRELFAELDRQAS
jgi:Uma2 family endonuclease